MRRGSPQKKLDRLAMGLARDRQPTGRLKADVIKKSKEDVKKNKPQAVKHVRKSMKDIAVYKKEIKKQKKQKVKERVRGSLRSRQRIK